MSKAPFEWQCTSQTRLGGLVANCNALLCPLHKSVVLLLCGDIKIFAKLFRSKTRSVYKRFSGFPARRRNFLITIECLENVYRGFGGCNVCSLPDLFGCVPRNSHELKCDKKNMKFMQNIESEAVWIAK